MISSLPEVRPITGAALTGEDASLLLVLETEAMGLLLQEVDISRVGPELDLLAGTKSAYEDHV